MSTACVLFAALAVVGSMFVALYRGSLMINGQSVYAVEVLSWGSVLGSGPGPEQPKMGLPLAFAVLLLLAAAVTARIARETRTADVVTAVGLAFLVGVVWALGMQIVAFVDSMRVTGLLDVTVSVDWGFGPGLGLLVLAVGFAGAATVLAFLPQRATEPEDPYQADLATPPFGFPVPEPGS
jgi:hypothetical protein